MLHTVDPCDVVHASDSSDNWGFALVTMFAVFLFSELGLTAWNLMKQSDRAMTKQE